MKNRILKYLTNEATSEDLDLLSDWILEEGNQQIFDDYIKIHFETTMAMNQPDTNKIKNKLLQEIKRNKNRKARFVVLNAMKYAAIALVFLALGYFYQNNAIVAEKENVLKPAEEPITITLDNGTVETLNPNENKKVKDNKGNIIGSQDKSKLTYQGAPSSDKLVYNTLNVPYGKRFDVILSDGTHVFLNSGTSLRYPVSFLEGKERAVFLTGEAYFDVAKDEKHPFIVNTNDVGIKVLGTKFNVSHYPEDQNINTVLIEGSVALHKRITAKENAPPLILKPGFKAEWHQHNNDISIENVDTRVYTAWVQGKLIFRNTPFRQIRQALERHYNVSIKNENLDLDEQLFDATFDIETIEEILESFSKSYAIAYKIVDNEVIIE
ncbi:FecR domain-containing protein [uncultured Kriegella sp.]|uniref:FecR family protein n=1 Tax=uncultured Kriegella sp. TaxID=1798910 RepID=UPI0030D75517|tara:strand:+ start:48046 stop:49188 length:1143 start_codon:yes stop_codon:yes gene_type:complete